MNSVANDDMTAESGGRFVVGLVWGFAFGFVAALLLAPKSGVQLRGQLADSVNRAGRRARDSYDRASETVSDVAGRAATMAEDLSERAANMTARLNSVLSKGSNASQAS